MDRFIAQANIRYLRDRLASEADQDARARVQRLLIEEEDKLGADLELLADLDRHIADGDDRIHDQRARVAAMERNGHNGLGHAQALLDGLIEGQLLSVAYRRRILIKLRERRL